MSLRRKPLSVYVCACTHSHPHLDKKWRGRGRTFGQLWAWTQGKAGQQRAGAPGIWGLFPEEAEQVEPWLPAREWTVAVRRRGRAGCTGPWVCTPSALLGEGNWPDELGISPDGSMLLHRIFGNVWEPWCLEDGRWLFLINTTPVKASKSVWLYIRKS